jgi:hypothetical protein
MLFAALYAIRRYMLYAIWYSLYAIRRAGQLGEIGPLRPYQNRHTNGWSAANSAVAYSTCIMYVYRILKPSPPNGRLDAARRSACLTCCQMARLPDCQSATCCQIARLPRGMPRVAKWRPLRALECTRSPVSCSPPGSLQNYLVPVMHAPT